jgi:RNA polymerase sigma factor (sigma-70 family)
MQDATDMELLRDYLRQGSEEAFARVVRRHVGLVYAAALRRVGNAGQSEEITQAVFIILARKAAGLRADTVLEGWLYETTRLTACSFLRQERRRQAREQEAFLMQNTSHEANNPQVWNQLAPLLEDAMASLGKKDRDAVVLRFFKEKNLREVAAALQTSEAAAQSRVHRAVEKLRKFFTKRGVILSAGVLTAAISANAAPAAPTALAEAVTAAALAKGTAAGGSTLTLIKGTLKLMAWTKVKMAVVVGVGVLLAAGTTTTVVKKLQSPALDGYLQDPELAAISNAPPMVVIQPTHFPWKDPNVPQPVGVILGRTMGLSAKDGTVYEKEIGRNIDLATAILKAYYRSFPTAHGPLSFARMILPPELHQIKVDYLVTTDDHPWEKFQAEIKRQFGWTAHVEMRDADVLLLKLNHTNAPGMKPTDGLSKEEWEAKLPPDKGIYRHNMTVARFAELVQGLFPKPVMNETGLTENYDFVTGNFGPDEAEQAFRDRLGLDLVPGREPLEMLVVEKVK